MKYTHTVHRNLRSHASSRSPRARLTIARPTMTVTRVMSIATRTQSPSPSRHHPRCIRSRALTPSTSSSSSYLPSFPRSQRCDARPVDEWRSATPFSEGTCPVVCLCLARRRRTSARLHDDDDDDDDDDEGYDEDDDDHHEHACGRAVW